MRIRKVFGKIHLVLGLTSGLIVFIVAVTGCLYAFKSEIESLTQPYRFVDVRGDDFMMPSELKHIAEAQLPGKEVHAIQYNETGRSAEVIFYHDEPEYYYYMVYLNPYSGEVLKVKDMDSDFFAFILDGHFYLWLPHEIGKQVSSYATLIFILMAVTGIILWWPRNKGARKQRFSIKWKSGWKRRNYDLHGVVGFYAMWIGIILASTGLVWGFQWFADGLYATAGGNKSLQYSEPVSDVAEVAAVMPAIDRVYLKMKSEYPPGTLIEVHPPVTENSPVAANANPSTRTYWKRDYRYFNQYTMEEQEVSHIYGRLAQADNADKLLRMNYDIHVGAILGFPGKLIMFTASLLIASLPVTGFRIWYGRRMSLKQKEKDNEEALIGQIGFSHRPAS